MMNTFVHPFSIVTFFRFLTFLLLYLGAGSLYAQVKLWGMTSSGGEFGAGAIINLNTNGSDFNAISFYKIAGAGPSGDLLKASNGKFYGMTPHGGRNGYGVIFEYDPVADTYLPVHHFSYGTDGANPYGSLIESGGKFYGMTSSGGSNTYGTLFEFNPTGNVLTVLKHFDNSTDGGSPRGSLLESGGKFYGMTNYGGSNTYGTLFELNPAGNVLTVLKNFDNSTDGGYPRGSLIESGGKFYGMTNVGGSNGYGTLFELNPAGNVLTVLKHFDYSTDGASPNGSLIESGGKFYGMTYQGGNNNAGTLFELNPAGNVLTVLKHFDNSTDGGYPYGSLIESGGKFYGMTSSGGNNGYGALLELNPAGNVFTVLRHFDSSPDGASPYGSLIESGGKFYGMTYQGGSNNAGTLFELNPAGNVFTVLRHFDSSTDGGYPYGSLLESGGKFYGMTLSGGSNGSGTLFELNPAGNVFTVLRHFDYSTDGGYPTGSLIESGGKFYGMTNVGGSNSYGTLFEFNPSGNVFTVLKHLDYSTDGAYPYGSLLESGGKFYGMTSSGGSNSSGTLFEFNPSGNVLTVLKHLDYSTDGGSPLGNLIESGGKFYGTTSDDGSNGYGTLFELNPAGNVFTVLRHFDYSPDGGSPYGSLVESGGKFYGMTYEGGSNGAGTLFELNPSGNVFTVLRHFSGPDGAHPFLGNLIAVGTTVDLTGNIEHHNGSPTGTGVKDATVALIGADTGSDLTPLSGDYEFSASATGNFTITPSKSLNKLNGVTVGDVTAIQQHVANILPIASNYLKVAADVNKSNSINTLDASIINQSLLGNPAALAQFKTSWRFVPQSHTMTNPPWGFPETISLTGVTSEQTGQDFYGIKTGDVTGNANPANFGAVNPLVFNVENRILEGQEEIALEFKANQLEDVAAFQFALHFDSEKLELAEVQPLAALPLTADNFGLFHISEGEIRVVWSQPNSAFLEEAAPVFSLKFKVLQGGGQLSEALQLHETGLPALAYNSALAESKVELNFGELSGTGDPASAGGVQLLQNRPNPFNSTTAIGFILPESCEAQLRVFDMSGRVFFSQKKNYAAGRHEETLDLGGVSGVLWYELVTPFGVLTKKMTAVKP